MKTLTSLALLIGFASSASAAIIITGDVSTPGTSVHRGRQYTGDVSTPGAPCTMTLTTDIRVSLTVNATDTTVALIFDEWVVSDGERNFVTLAPAFVYSINDGPNQTATATFVDNLAQVVGSATANDGYFLFNHTSALQAGSTLTLKAGTYNFSGASGVNPAVVGTFNGTTFAVDNLGNPLGPQTAVPEPSAVLLGAVGALALLRRRR